MLAKQCPASACMLGLGLVSRGFVDVPTNILVILPEWQCPEPVTGQDHSGLPLLYYCVKSVCGRHYKRLIARELQLGNRIIYHILLSYLWPDPGRQHPRLPVRHVGEEPSSLAYLKNCTFKHLNIFRARYPWPCLGPVLTRCNTLCIAGFVDTIVWLWGRIWLGSVRKNHPRLLLMRFSPRSSGARSSAVRSRFSKARRTTRSQPMTHLSTPRAVLSVSLSEHSRRQTPVKSRTSYATKPLRPKPSFSSSELTPRIHWTVYRYFWAFFTF